jgi:hypothetical protein
MKDRVTRPRNRRPKGGGEWRRDIRIPAAALDGQQGDARGREGEERAERVEESEGVIIPLVGHGNPGRV